MLTNSEYAQFNRVPTTLEGEIADFAMFTIDLGETTQNGELCFPHLQGKGVNLWDITPVLQVLPPNKVEVNETIRQANLAKYISQGFGFESPDGQTEVVDTPEEGDEWTKFFALDTNLVGGKCRRRGGIKSHGSFEGFVDSAQ